MNPIPKKVKGIKKRVAVEYQGFRLTTTFLSDPEEKEEEEGKEEEKNQTLDLNETQLIQECLTLLALNISILICREISFSQMQKINPKSLTNFFSFFFLRDRKRTGLFSGLFRREKYHKAC